MENRDYRTGDSGQISFRRRRSRSRSRSYSPPDRRDYESSRRRRSLSPRERKRSDSRERYHNSHSRDRSEEGEVHHDRDRRQDNRRNRIDPCDTIALHGLKESTSERTIVLSLQKLDAQIEAAKVVRDHNTSRSRCFGFARFPSIDEATYFLDSHPSGIVIEGAKINLDYSHRSLVLPEDSEWICAQCNERNYKSRRNCYRCKLPRSEKDLGPSSAINDGRRDVGDIPNQILLVRGLDPTITEEMLYHEFEGKGPIKEVRLVKDRQSEMSMCFGFVVFSDIPSAALALTTILDPANPPLTIQGQPVQVSWANTAAFSPSFTPSPFATSVVIDPNGNEVPLLYWDNTAYASAYPTLADQKKKAAAASTTTMSSTGKKVRKVKKSERKEKKSEIVDHSMSIPHQGLGESLTQIADVTQSIEEETVVAQDAESLEKKKEKLPSTGKVSKQLQKWMEKQAEIKGLAPVAVIQPETAETQKGSEIPTELLMAIPSDEKINAEYTDLELIACLLCERKFEVLQTLEKHLTASQLHQKNLSDLKERLFGSKENGYRNRAAERRRIHNQPDRPTDASYPHHFARPSSYSSNVHMHSHVESAPAVPLLPENNVGARMLQSMGWKAGEGLGKDKSGIKNPLQADGYTRGAGLGSESRS